MLRPDDHLSFSQVMVMDMSRTLLAEETLRESSMSYAWTRIHARGEVDGYELDCGARVEVELTPGPGEDRFTLLSFDELRISDAEGAELTVIGEDGKRLDSEALQVIIWEKLEACELLDGYMQGREAVAAPVGEVIRLDQEAAPGRDLDPEYA